MKKSIFLLLVTMAVFCSCDPDRHTITDYKSTTYIVWANDSDHKITLSNISAVGVLDFEKETIFSGESFQKVTVRMGGVLHPQSYEMIVVFDDDIKVIYRDSDIPVEHQEIGATYVWEYNPVEEENYKFEELGDHAYRYTYTFTNTDYEAAKKLNNPAH